MTNDISRFQFSKPATIGICYGEEESIIFNDYLLLKQRALYMQRLAGHMEQHRDDGSEDGKIRMVETRLYIGLNDAETKKQIFETEQYVEQLKNLCFTYHVPFSVAFEEGGYFHESGEYIEEKTLVLTMIDAEADIIQKIAKDLCGLFNQESILVTEDIVKGYYIM